MRLSALRLASALMVIGVSAWYPDTFNPSPTQRPKPTPWNSIINGSVWRLLKFHTSHFLHGLGVMVYLHWANRNRERNSDWDQTMGHNRSCPLSWFMCNVTASMQFHTTHLFLGPVPVSVPPISTMYLFSRQLSHSTNSLFTWYWLYWSWNTNHLDCWIFLQSLFMMPCFWIFTRGWEGRGLGGRWMLLDPYRKKCWTDTQMARNPSQVRTSNAKVIQP